MLQEIYMIVFLLNVAPRMYTPNIVFDLYSFCASIIISACVLTMPDNLTVVLLNAAFFDKCCFEITTMLILIS